MDQRILEFEKPFRKPNLPDIHPGDTVRVHQRIEEGGKTRIHEFEGTVLATKHGRGMSGSFTVRKIGAQGVGIEQSFFWHAPTLFKVERIRKGEARRAKLYYLRRLTARASRKLRGREVGEVWEEEAVKEAVEKEQAEQAEAAGSLEETGKKADESRTESESAGEKKQPPSDGQPTPEASSVKND